MFSDL